MKVDKFGTITVSVDPETQHVQVYLNNFDFDAQGQTFESEDEQMTRATVAALQDAMHRVLLTFAERRNAPIH